MPEGPEVKRISSGVAKRIVGKTITDVIGLDPRYDVRNSSAKQVRDDVSQFLVEITTDGLTVDEVNCYGKFIYWKLTNNSTNEVWTIFHTLGMAGTWRFTPNNNHLAMEWKFDDGSSIYYRDSRRFGTFKFFKGPSGRDLLEKKISKDLGPDLLANSVTLEKFSEALRKGSRSSWTLAKVLMNQKVVAGIGNYLKAEILFETKLSPHTTVDQLSPTEMENLYHACIKHIHNAYAAKGATIKNYVLPDGTPGSAQYKFKVYAQKTCPAGHLISREETEDKRTTHWCSTCQSVPKSFNSEEKQEKLKINVPFAGSNYCI